MGIKPKCVPCPEREGYIAAVSKKGFSRVTVGVKNRYIDEFIQFYQAQYGSPVPGKVQRLHIEEFAKYVADQDILRATATFKLREVLACFDWLCAHGKICSNPGAGLKVKDFIKWRTQ